MSVSIENIDEWADAYIEALEDMVADTVTSLHSLGDRIAQREQRAAPDRSRINAQFTVQRGAYGHVFYVDVGPDPWEGIRMAHYEFGTRRQPPRPFMRRIVLEEAAGWNPARA